jgi:hypothetical protein
MEAETGTIVCIARPRNEARRIAANIAKLPQRAAAEATGLYGLHFRYDLDSGHFAGLHSLSWATSGHSGLFHIFVL